jgi:hypothetical protein
MAKGGAPRWTEEELANFRTRSGKPLDMAVLKIPADVPATPPHATGPLDKLYALGRLPKGRMNKTEAAYAQRLAALKHDGTIQDWKFHAIRVRLADSTFYEPDFLVLGAAGQIEIHETKGGFTTDKGQLKVKLCAEVLPWFRVFKCARQKSGQWTITEFNP